jgi:hypothetical protein
LRRSCKNAIFETFSFISDGKIPRDATVIIEKYEYVRLPIYRLFCAMAGFGVVLAIAFFAVNIAFRKTR